MNTSRKIIHIDMDAFYASIEQRDNPKYKGHPLVVGGKSERGVVAAASYEARKFGVYSAMAIRKALIKCPHLIVVQSRMSVYKAVSLQIREIFREYTNLVEPLSLDEAFLDVTINKKGIASASILADEIRAKIWNHTGLTASAGVSINKFLAKVASDMDKPNGMTLIAPEQASAFVAALPIEKFFGVGKVTAGKMHRLGIKTGADLLKWSLKELQSEFGKAGQSYYDIVHIEDKRPVNPNRERHSVGTEDTFERDLKDREEMLAKLESIANEVVRRMGKSNFSGRTLTLKVKYANFEQITRSRTVDNYIEDTNEMMDITRKLFAPVEIPPHGVRLLGLTVSNTNKKETENNEKWEQFRLPFPPIQ